MKGQNHSRKSVNFRRNFRIKVEQSSLHKGDKYAILFKSVIYSCNMQDTDYYYDYGIKRKKTDYYKMRYYVKDNGKIVGGKWTSVKKVRVK